MQAYPWPLKWASWNTEIPNRYRDILKYRCRIPNRLEKIPTKIPNTDTDVKYRHRPYNILHRKKLNYCVRGGHKPARWPWPTSPMPFTCLVVIPDHLTKFDDNLIIVGELLENVGKFRMSQSKRLKFKIYLHDCCAHPLFLADSMQLRCYKNTQILMSIGQWILHKKTTTHQRQ